MLFCLRCNNNPWMEGYLDMKKTLRNLASAGIIAAVAGATSLAATVTQAADTDLTP